MSIFINLAVIFWSLFPSLVSYTDNQPDPLKVQLSQLVANSDLLIDDNSDNVPDGFQYYKATDRSLTNGIAKFTVTAQWGGLQFVLSGYSGQVLYTFGRFKSDSNNVRLTNAQTISVPHSGSGQFEFASFVETLNNNIRYLQVGDYRSSGWTPIEVDYIGAINITDLVSRGMLPSGLSDNEYKTLIDDILLELGSTFQDDYFYSESLNDSFNWFRSGFVSKNGDRDFLDYLGFFVWLVVPYLFVFLVYKLLKGVIRG